MISTDLLKNMQNKGQNIPEKMMKWMKFPVKLHNVLKLFFCYFAVDIKSLLKPFFYLLQRMISNFYFITEKSYNWEIGEKFKKRKAESAKKCLPLSKRDNVSQTTEQTFD